MKKLLLILLCLPMIGFGQEKKELNYLERKWSLEGGVEYQVIVDGIIDTEDAIIQVNLHKLSLSSVDMIVQYKDGKTRFLFKDFKKGGNNSLARLGDQYGPYDKLMVKKGKWRKWMIKYGKTDIANYLEKNIEKLDDEWE